MGQGMQCADRPTELYTQASSFSKASPNTTSAPKTKGQATNNNANSNTAKKLAIPNELHAIKTTTGHFAGAHGATLCRDGMHDFGVDKSHRQVRIRLPLLCCTQWTTSTGSVSRMPVPT